MISTLPATKRDDVADAAAKSMSRAGANTDDPTLAAPRAMRKEQQVARVILNAGDGGICTSAVAANLGMEQRSVAAMISNIRNRRGLIRSEPIGEGRWSELSHCAIDPEALANYVETKILIGRPLGALDSRRRKRRTGKSKSAHVGRE